MDACLIVVRFDPHSISRLKHISNEGGTSMANASVTKQRVLGVFFSAGETIGPT